jgi:Tfp pilus assembly protein PilN
MARQINLYQPVLLTQRRRFSARNMALALLVLLLALAGLSGYSWRATQSLQAQLGATLRAGQDERTRLQQALAQAPGGDTAALQHQLEQARRDLAEREALLQELGAPGQTARSGVLLLLARTLPPTAWLTEVAVTDDRLELRGLTRQPETLRTWFGQLQDEPSLRGLPLRAVKVERKDTAAGEAWAFQLASGQPVAAAEPRP